MKIFSEPCDGIVVFLDAQGNKVEASPLEFNTSVPNNVTSIFAKTQGGDEGYAQPQFRINLATSAQILKIAKIGRSQALALVANRPTDGKGYTGFEQMKTLNPDITVEMWDLLKRNANFIFNEQDLV